MTRSPLSGEVMSVGSLILALIFRRLRVRAFECFFLGTAIYSPGFRKSMKDSV